MVEKEKKADSGKSRRHQEHGHKVAWNLIKSFR